MAKEGRWSKLAKGPAQDFWKKLGAEFELESKSNRALTAQALRAGPDERFETAQVIAAIVDRLEALEKPKPKK